MLGQVRFVLPDRPAEFGHAFLGMFAGFGALVDDRCRLSRANPRHLPEVSVMLGHTAVPRVEFTGDQEVRVELRNTTGIARSSPYAYEHISLDDYRARSAGLRFTALDHIGFDLPWFQGTHPEVSELRETLAGSSAYHRFPTGEDWDFILPATPEEIAGGELVPAAVRRPKVEIVSLDTVSVPLIQVDYSVDLPYVELAGRFPEGLLDADRGSVWVYIDNPYGIDLCLVLNEGTGVPDWSEFFRGHRILPSR